jgi:hypothetical protein
MTDVREPLSVEAVWAFMAEGCSANEIADYGHVSRATAVAMMNHAARVFARAA